MIIDSHSHIYSEEFDVDAEKVIEEAREAGVGHHVLCNVDATTIERIRAFHYRFASCTSMAMGIHPTSVDGDWEKNLKIVGEELFANRREYVAIGEVGMDLYWDDTFEKEQARVFAQQVDWALELDLPIVIHTRKAYAEAFRVLKGFNKDRLRGVFHCFGGGVEEAKKAVGMGFKLGVGGVLTYKNSNLGDILQNVRLEDFMMETDAPYLPPVPYRGKRNEPKYLVEVRDKIASVFNVSTLKVEEITSENAIGLFGLE